MKNKNTKTANKNAKSSKVVAKKVAKVATKKVEVPAKPAKPLKQKMGASFFFDATQLKKLSTILAKKELSLNALANQLLFAAIK